MKLLLMLVLSAACFGQTIQDRVKQFENPKDYKVEYDKFKKQTVVSFANYFTDGKPGTLRFSAFAVIPDEGEVAYFWHFRQLPKTYPFSREQLRILVDSEVMTIDSSDIDYEAMFTLTPAEMRKIVAAKSVEIQIARYEGRFGNATLTKLRHLATLPRLR